MATRQDMWIAKQILEFTDIIHDCLDACRYLLKGVEPDSGFVSPDTQDEINLRIRSYSNAALTNKVALLEFVTKIGTTEAQNALTALSVDAPTVIADVNTMETYGTYVYNNTLTEDHTVMANYLDANLPKFISVRRRWAI